MPTNSSIAGKLLCPSQNIIMSEAFCASGAQAEPEIFLRRGVDGKVWAKYATTDWTPVECEDTITVGALRKIIKEEFKPMLENWAPAQFIIKLESGTEPLNSEQMVASALA